MTAIATRSDEKSKRFNEDSEILKFWKEAHDFSFRAWSPFLVEAQRDLAFILGDQWDHNDRQFLESQKRNALVFNRARRNIKMVTGYERKTRHSFIAQPIENSDEIGANIFTASMLWLYNRENIHHTNSDAFEAALKTGINLLELFMDYNDDPINGDIKVSRVPYNAFLLDPRFTKRDLSDCQFILQRRLLSHDEAKSLLPSDRAKDIDLLQGKQADGKFPNMQKFSVGKMQDTLRFDQFWTRRLKNGKILVDLETGDSRTLTDEQIKDDRLQFIAEQMPNIAIIEKQIPTVDLHIIIEDNVFWSGEDPWKIEDFPHVPVMAFWDPEHFQGGSHFHDGTPGRDDLGHFFSRHHSGDFALKLQSLVRCQRDPQTEVNKRRSKMLDILDKQINAGWIAEDDSIVNRKSLYQSGQGPVVWKKAGAPSPERIPAADFGQSHIALSQMMDNDLVEIPGITEELLGRSEDSNMDVSGVLAKTRQGAALTVLQDLMDNFNLARKLQGSKIIKMMQNNWSPQKFMRITNEELPEEFFNGQFGKYDVVVEEAIETPTQKALAYSQLLEAVRQGIVPLDAVRDELIDLSPIQKKKQVKEAMQRMAESQKQVQEEQLEDQRRLRELQRAKTFSDVSLGVERIARADADRGLANERISELQQNNANAFLDRIKAIKEIEQMDDQRLFQLLELSQRIENAKLNQASAIEQSQDMEAQQALQQAMSFVQDQPAQQQGIQQEI